MTVRGCGFVDTWTTAILVPPSGSGVTRLSMLFDQSVMTPAVPLVRSRGGMGSSSSQHFMRKEVFGRIFFTIGTSKLWSQCSWRHTIVDVFMSCWTYMVLDLIPSTFREAIDIFGAPGKSGPLPCSGVSS